MADEHPPGDDRPTPADQPVGSEPELDHLRHEVEALAAENERLRAAATAPREPRHIGRWFASIALIVVGSLLVPVSVLGVWLNRTITNPDRYVETVAPLAKNRAIQDAVAKRVETALFNAVDVEAEVRQVLPDRAAVLAAPISSGIENVISQVIERLVRSDQFANLWEEANRAAATQVSNVLTNKAGKRGVVEIDLTNVVKEASSRLGARGIPFVGNLGNTPVEFEVFQGEEVAQLQDAFRLFDRLSTILPWLTVLILAAGVFVAPVRRRGLLYAAVGWTVCTFGLLLLIALGRQIYLGSLPVGASLAANEAFFDIISRFLRGAGRTVLAVGLVVLAFTLLFGPSRPAVQIRRLFSRLGDAAGEGAEEHGVDLGPAGRWVARNVVALRVVIGVVVVIWVLALSRPSAGNVLWIALFALVALVVLELVARIGAPRTADAVDPADEPEPAVTTGGGDADG